MPAWSQSNAPAFSLGPQPISSVAPQMYPLFDEYLLGIFCSDANLHRWKVNCCWCHLQFPLGQERASWCANRSKHALHGSFFPQEKILMAPSSLEQTGIHHTSCGVLCTLPHAYLIPVLSLACWQTLVILCCDDLLWLWRYCVGNICFLMTWEKMCHVVLLIWHTKETT